MNILEALSVRIPDAAYGQFYEVPLNDILLSHEILEEGCPVQDETECPPLFQTRLISRDVLNDLVRAWSRLEGSVSRDNGELVLSHNREDVQCHRSRSVVGIKRQRDQKISPGNSTAGHFRALPDVVPCENGKLDTTVDARDRGLDETLSETFPCSDALSSIPDPPIGGIVWQ